MLYRRKGLRFLRHDTLLESQNLSAAVIKPNSVEEKKYIQAASFSTGARSKLRVPNTSIMNVLLPKLIAS